MRAALKLALLWFACAGYAHATTWFVRADGGTRYSANVTAGQCNGLADTAYPGSGVNQACAYNGFRYMWDDDSGLVGAGAWVIAGGDTVVVRGCHASMNQVNPADPTCRIGWDQGSGGGPTNLWCQFVGSYTCYNPPIPAGTSGAHTRILGSCAYDGTCTDPILTRPGNLTQLFGGFSLVETFNLSSTSYVDIKGIELTTHNGVCSRNGSPAATYLCSTSPPLDDYAQSGFLTNNATSNVTFQNVYVHGFNAYGLYGPIGGPITMSHVFIGFNTMAGWNFDDGSDTPDAAGSSITASYVTMEGNGCYEQYPITNVAWPARACYDPISNGFGDGWSGQDTEIDGFTCDHCVMQYNTKDGFIGPHTQIAALTITNSFSGGNMGSQWKWNQAPNGTILFQNNLTLDNCLRQSVTLPNAIQNFAQSSGLVGSYLTNFCRAGGFSWQNLTRSGTVNHFYGNTEVNYGVGIFQVGCGYYTVGNHFNQETNCNTSQMIMKDNNYLAYTNPSSDFSGSPPTLYCSTDSITNACFITNTTTGLSFTSTTFTNEFGFSLADPCSGSITCVDPLMQSEPTHPWPGSETALDVFNPFISNNSFYPTASSPLIGAGTAIAGLTTDYYGVTRPNPPSMGGVEGAQGGSQRSGSVISSGRVLQ